MHIFLQLIAVASVAIAIQIHTLTMTVSLMLITRVWYHMLLVLIMMIEHSFIMVLWCVVDELLLTGRLLKLLEKPFSTWWQTRLALVLNH